MKRHLFPFLIAVLAAALFTALLYVEFYKTLDSRLYDLMLRIKPGIEEDSSIILLEVDDLMLTESVYPLPRDIYADGLILLKEFDPAWTMLDVEFVDDGLGDNAFTSTHQTNNNYAVFYGNALNTGNAAIVSNWVLKSADDPTFGTD